MDYKLIARVLNLNFYSILYKASYSLQLTFELGFTTRQSSSVTFPQYHLLSSSWFYFLIYLFISPMSYLRRFWVILRVSYCHFSKYLLHFCTSLIVVLSNLTIGINVFLWDLIGNFEVNLIERYYQLLID
jgi:hypothetical protein